MSNAAGFAALDRLLADLKYAEKDLVSDIAKEAGPLVEAAIRKRAAAGLDPDGNPWAAKKDGGRPLAGIEKHIQCTVEGQILRVTLTGNAVWHHHAKGDTRPARRVLPDGGSGLPDYVVEAIMEAANRVWRRRMGGR